jgi:K+-sensing histidine kinase KdpD
MENNTNIFFKPKQNFMQPKDEKFYREAEKLKAKLLKIIIQELRSPVSAIIGCTDLLREDVGSEDKNSLLETMSHASEKSRELLDVAMMVTEIDQDKLSHKMRPYKISNLVDFAIKDNIEAIQNKGIEVLSPEDVEFTEVVIDPDLIKEVLKLLLSVMIKDTPQHGEIKIIINELVDRIELAIDNSGKGFSDNQLKVMSGFFADPGFSSKSECPGLKLAIVKFIMTIHYASITASNNEQGGASLKLIFPVNDSRREEINQILSQLN